MNRLAVPQRHIDVALNVGVDWDEIILALKLKAKTSEINDCDRIWTGRGYLTKELAETFPQGRLIEISCSGDGEPGRAQRVGDKTRVIRRRGKTGRTVLIVANDQSEARLLSAGAVLSDQ
jgi:hypothetical protein